MNRERGVVTIPRYDILQEADAIPEFSISRRGEFAIGPNGEKRERKYDAFVQLLIKKGNKIAAVSFPLPLGVTPEMGQEVLRQTLYPGEENVPVRTFGEEKDLRAMVRMGIPDNLLGRFVAAAENVVNQQHPKKNHKAVGKFYKDQYIRKQHTDKVEKDIQKILEDKGFLQISAWRDENRGKRIFVMEHFFDQERGKLMGVGPAPDFKIFEIAGLGAGECHREWLQFYNEFGALEGDWVLGHVDGGPTVDSGGRRGDGCAGSANCSIFFDEMENDSVDKVFDLSTGQSVDRIIDPGLRALLKDNNDGTCSTCKKKKEECQGH